MSMGNGKTAGSLPPRGQRGVTQDKTEAKSCQILPLMTGKFNKVHPLLHIHGCLLCYEVDLSSNLFSVACQTPLSMGFSRQEYWNGLPFPSLGDLPDPGIEPGSSALQADSLPTEL